MAKKQIKKYVFEPGIGKDSSLYPNAAALLEANKAFLQAQVIAFINNQIANNTAPYNGYTYASQKCTRDVGLILDAITHDVKYGGNVKTRQVADYFWIDGEPMIRGDVSPETTAQAYLRDIINNFIFTNTTVSPSYGQTAVPQVKITGQNAETGASALNSSLWNAVSSVITNGITAMPAKISGVSSIRMIGNYTVSEVLLITNTDTGEILYSFADPANSITIELKQGRSSGDGNLLSDVDFPAWWRTEDAITTINLSADTSNLTEDASLQIYVDEPFQTIKPWEFGTDAIERMRVAMPQAMLDADFEYGLQPTKWQGYGQVRGYPSLFEQPGTDLSIQSITTDASIGTGGFGSSLITVRTNGTHGLSVGQPITVVGLNSSVSGFARAEGTFLVYKVTSAVTFNYYASAKVGTSVNENLTTSFVQIRQAQYYTGANIGQPTYSVVSNGTNSTVLSKFNTPPGEFQFAFDGDAPVTGSPVSGSLAFAGGTSVSGVIGSATVVAELLDTTSPSDLSITLTSASGILEGMAIDDGTGNAIFVNSIAGSTLNLSGAIGQTIQGVNGSSTGVSGSLIESIGVGGTFDISKSSGIYNVLNSDDSTALGQNYAVGDLIKVAGTSVGGATPANDITITVTGVDSGGSITTFTWTGVATAGDASYTGISGSVVNPLPGAGAQFTINRNSGNYTTATVTSTGSNYKVGQRIIVLGTDLGGTSPENDCTITINTVDLSGGILTVSAAGTSRTGDTVSIYPVLNISEALVGTLTDATVVNAGAIATLQISFSTPHGLVPGTPMFNQITSNPAPDFASTARTMPASSTWSGIAFGNEYFIAVQNGSNNTAISTNGTNWAAGGTLPSSGNWTSVAAGQISGIWYFVAIQSGGTAAAYSTDNGSTWSSATLPSSGTWNSVTFYQDRFIAVRAGSTAAAYSIDGVNWVASTLPSSSTWTDVVGGLVGTSDYIVAIASGGTAAAYSIDLGVTWVAATLPASVTWSSVAFGNSRFFAVARGSTSAAISTNGIIWTAVTLPSSANWNNVAFGDDNFYVVADGSTSALTSFDAVSGSFIERILPTTATWEETAYGFYPLTGGIFVTVGNTTNALSTVLISANHQLAAGPFTVTSVPSPNVVRYAARATGIINTSVPITGTAYVRPDAFFVHRPFDGGVQLGTGGPAHGVQAVRQSKKYIRYQSGKGMFYNTGALFAPSYSIRSATASGTATNSIITVTTDDNDHGLQPGAVIEIIGMTSFEYNGEYTVEGIVDSRSFIIRNSVVLSTTTAQLTAEAKVILKRWHGSTVRIGPFDEQNGVFYQYDGQTLAVGKRSSTNQLTGTISMTIESNLVTGSNTKFAEQLAVGDKIVIRGMSHVVTGISSNTSMTVNPDWRGANNITGARFAKTEDLIFPQSDWNIDTLDGTGPSGYNILPWRMQMIAIQYTWYAVGFIEFMLRGGDGRFVFLHRIRNSNVNTEAYMRTANLPVRYEVENTSAKSKLRSTINSTATSMEVFDAKYFPTNGTVYIDNELITYSGKNGNRLTGLTRASSLTNFSAGQNRTFTAGAASSHTAGTGVVLVSNTASPTISHWGSALITDGSFDEDRGYLFSYTATGVSASTSRQTAFMIRLSPSVSNALTGDLGERELLNRAQLLLQSIAISADSTASAGAILIEGVLNPRNYPSNPANIIWNGISSQGAGGQPSFAQIALGGSINWGGVPLTTTTATVSNAVTLGTTARAFNIITQSLNARNDSGLSGYFNAVQNGRDDFLITNSAYDAFEASTPILVGDSLSASELAGGTTIQSITRSYLGSNFTRIQMNRPATSTRNNSFNINCTNQYSVIFNTAYNSARNTLAVRTSDIDSGNILVGDTLTSGFLPSGRSVSIINRNVFKISGNQISIITMNGNASSTGGFGSDQSLTVQVPQTAATYATTNYLFFTNSTWNSSGAGINTRVAPAFTNFPGGTAVSAVVTRVLGTTTVVRVTFTQTLTTSVSAGGTVTFEFGDPQYALPGEQVFAFVANPGNTVDLDLSQLKELTNTAIGGRGTFPNGPDVLAINILKITGTAVPSSIILRWSEAQA